MGGWPNRPNGAMRFRQNFKAATRRLPYGVRLMRFELASFVPNAPAFRRIMTRQLLDGGLALRVTIHRSGRPWLLKKYRILYATMVESIRKGKRYPFAQG